MPARLDHRDSGHTCHQSQCNSVTVVWILYLCWQLMFSWGLQMWSILTLDSLSWSHNPSTLSSAPRWPWRLSASWIHAWTFSDTAIVTCTWIHMFWRDCATCIYRGIPLIKLQPGSFFDVKQQSWMVLSVLCLSNLQILCFCVKLDLGSLWASCTWHFRARQSICLRLRPESMTKDVWAAQTDWWICKHG